MVDPLYNNQTEPRDISYTLDVEQLDLNLYRSRNLTLPYQARGVFGGQVISQALVAATRCVKPEFTLHVRVHSHTTISVREPSSYAYIPRRANGHSRCMYVSFSRLIREKEKYNDFAFKAYFTLSVSASVPLLYYVEQVRDGRSHSTRSVRAVQGGRVVFVMLCSFQIPEFGQPSHHWTMPRVPRPDECEGEIECLKRMASRPDHDLTEERRSQLIAWAKVRYFITPF
jgi:acyl-CoA thioesterase